MRRRDFITLLSSAVAWPPVARAQQQAMPVVGLLTARAAGDATVATFRQSLQDTGFVERQNVAIEYRFAENQYDRLPALAADLVRRQVAVIATGGNAVALAAKAAAVTIPVVFETLSDPVRIGLVASLSRPGGNMTGVTQLNMEIGPKLLELMHEVVPAAKDIALLLNPKNPNAESMSKNLQAAAATRVPGIPGESGAARERETGRDRAP